MSDPFDLGVLYTDHAPLARGTPFPSLWSYESCARNGRLPVAVAAGGQREFWLHRTDPLLNTMLPGTQVSLVVNMGDGWACGRSLPSTSQVPSICVVGPITTPQLLRVGRRVRALGAVVPSVLARDLLGVPARSLVNQIVPLEAVWAHHEVDRLRHSVSTVPIGAGVAALRRALLRRLDPGARIRTPERAAAALLTARRGHCSIDRMAARCGLSRQRLGQRFHDATGLPPKLFARIVRFQSLVHWLLLTDVSRWSEVASGAGFYDQSHMINEFRSFAGAAPTAFFQPHGDSLASDRTQVRGRPSEWLQLP